jgi:hypothetical protein
MGIDEDADSMKDKGWNLKPLLKRLVSWGLGAIMNPLEGRKCQNT